MKTEEPKRYEIDSFEKLVNVINEDNFESLTKDLIMWLAFHVDAMKLVRKNLPEKLKKKTNWQLNKSTFIWIDDGKNEMKEVVIRNQTTGEVQTLRFEKRENQKDTE
jgi:hypothetical protein